jgi:hypothetical protein
MPGWSWITKTGDLFTSYLEHMATEFGDSEAILIWDLCNEPFSYTIPICEMGDIVNYERQWLESMYHTLKQMKLKAPVGISMYGSYDVLEYVEPISDILMIHPYYKGDLSDESLKCKFEAKLDAYVEASRKTGKPLLATETCWGELDDEERVANMRYTLAQLKQRGIGWLAHALHHSLVADLHREEHGPVGIAGYMAFIEADGSLRKGHEAFNEF